MNNLNEIFNFLAEPSMTPKAAVFFMQAMIENCFVDDCEMQHEFRKYLKVMMDIEWDREKFKILQEE